MGAKTIVHEYVNGICTTCGDTREWIERDEQETP